MAHVRTCDRCGKSPAHTVIAGASLESVVVPDAPTGHSEQADACEEHQEEVLQILHEHVVEQLREQIPHLRVIQQHAERRDAANRDLAELRPTLAAIEDPAKVPAKVAKQRDQLLATVAEAEAERLQELEAATAKSDARRAALPKKLQLKR